jgi:hypothetical protein
MGPRGRRLGPWGRVNRRRSEQRPSGEVRSPEGRAGKRQFVCVRWALAVSCLNSSPRNPTAADLLGHYLVTADDDVLYPRYWLDRLLRSARQNPHTVQCFRARTVALRDGQLWPYRLWPPCKTKDPSVKNFATGVSGVAYPPRMVAALRNAGQQFLASAPTSDDVWLHRVAVESEIAIGQVHRRPRHFPVIPGSQSVSLMTDNVADGGNDRQIRATYTERALSLLVESRNDTSRQHGRRPAQLEQRSR